jgi:glycosyltransferase involved in cell wall biosynthesis
MTPPAVSVIIPTFNRANLIDGAVESVLSQTASDVEVIVVDDGSTDGTHEKLAPFGDRIGIIRQKNTGVSSARNAGIRAARGQWIAFLDSDDRWRPGKLERQLDCLQKVEAGVCFTRCIADDGELIRDVDGLRLVREGPAFCYLENPLDLLGRKGWHPALPSMLVQKHLLERAGMFDESLFTAEDTQLVYRLAFITRFAYVDEPLTVVARTPPDGLTGNVDPEVARKRLTSYLRVQGEAYWRLLEVDPKKAKAPRRVFGYFISRRAELACGANELESARAYAKNGLFLASHVRSFLICLAIYLFPSLFHKRFRKKWFEEPRATTR